MNTLALGLGGLAALSVLPHRGLGEALKTLGFVVLMVSTILAWWGALDRALEPTRTDGITLLLTGESSTFSERFDP